MKNNLVQLRISESDKKKLQELAQKNEMSMSEYIVNQIRLEAEKANLNGEGETRHYVYIEDATTRSAVFEEKYLGTDLKQAKKQADYFANHLTALELKKSDEVRLVACDIPDDVDLDDLNGIFDDYVTEIITDYKNNMQ